MAAPVAGFNCGICFDEINESVRTNCDAACNSTFHTHKKCLKTWRERSNTCPNCRNELALSNREISRISDVKFTKIFAFCLVGIALVTKYFDLGNKDRFTIMESEGTNTLPLPNMTNEWSFFYSK